MAGKLSRNFDWKEFTKSDTATRLHIINEVTTWEVRDNIKALVDDILQPLRDAWGQPLFIKSGYRCLKLNAAVGGVPTSQHVMGKAADVACSNPYELAKLAVKLKLGFDQMIVYPTFVHFSYDKDGRNRGQILYNKRYKGAKDL